MPDYIDITRYGTRGLRGTRASVAGDNEIDPTIEAIRREAAKSYHNRRYVDSKHDPGAVSNIGLELEQSGYGKSTYDKGIPYSQLENIDDWRGQEQSGIVQLANGILKGITTAGTTFLDGTAGFLFGLGQWAATGDAAMLFNNDLSKSLREFNQMMEEVLPNYRTKDEIENPWAAKNLFSMNTFADDFLKNIGFTVGAFYSGNAYLSALKGLGAGAMSTTAAKTIGSILSGFSEGRIEAGNLYDEQIKAEQPNIDAAKQQIKAEILSSPEYAQLGQQLSSEYEAKKAAIEAKPDNFVSGVDGRMVNTKQAELNQLYNEYSTKLKQLENNAMSEVNRRAKALEDNVKERARSAALADLALNAIYLPFTDAYAYGKLYGRKFTGKNELARNVGTQTKKAIDRAAEQEVAEETLGKRIMKKGKEYIANPTKTKSAALKGLKIGLSEGAEEMNQAWFSSFASNKFQPDSPDAYYNALTNDDYQIQTKDMMTSITEGFMDSWGNSETYKEGLVGFLTGLIGMPTFGKVQNSDSITYLGKGKMIGLSGGILGEIQNSNRLNREASEAAQVMNKLVDKVTDAESFFVRAKSFTDATDGYSKTDNKFEFNNAADNELFHAIDAFARTGRLQDLRDIINEDIDNATPEQLEDIARNFSSDTNQFKNADNSDMASTEEGQKQMKEIINQRKQEISDGIDSYVEALEAARRIGNNSLSADQVAELAWLKWKMDKFEDRFNSVKKEDLEKLSDLQNAIAAFKRGRGRGMIDEESEAGQNILKSIDSVEFFIDLLKSAKTPLQFGTLVKNSGNTRDWLKHLGYPIFEDMVGFDAEEFDKLMNDLDDVVKIAEASEEFNKRYKEFKANPTKLIKNREKIDKKKNAEKSVKDKSDFKTALEDMSVSEIAAKIRGNEISKEQIDSIEESERKAPIEPDVDPTVAQKIELAEGVNDARQRAIDALEARMEAEGGSQAIEDAIKQVEEAATKAESPEDFFDMSQAAFIDAQLLSPDEPVALTPEQEAALDEELQERRDAAAAINKEVLEQVKRDRETASNMPNAQPADSAEPDTTGHDETTKASSVQQAADKKEKTEKKEPKKDYTGEAAQLLQSVGIVAPSKTNVNALATLLESFDDYMAINDNNLLSIARCRDHTAYRSLGRQIDANYNANNDGISPLIDGMLLTHSNQPVVATQPKQPDTTADTDVPTANVSRTQIEGQEAAESKRKFPSFSGPMNFWKPATTEYPIHDDNRRNVTYANQLLNEAVSELIKLLPVADKDVAALRTHLSDIVRELFTKSLSEVQNTNSYRLAQLLVDANKLDNVLQMLLDNKVANVNLQRVRRTVAVTEFLQRVKAYDRLDSGQVQRKHKLSFVTYRELNEAAGETVILVVDDDLGDEAIIGDLMSKNELVVGNQIGLVPFIEHCEEELKKHQGEDVVELPGNSTVGQIMIGRVPYTNEYNRPTLNTVFEGQPFRIGVAMTGGKNAIIKSDSSPLSSSQSDEDASIWQPLNAIKGQPYILLPTGNADKKYICVPFLMPVYNENVADSKLGKAIRDVVSGISDAMSEKNAVRIKNALRELLSLKDVHVNYHDGDKIKITITRHGENHQFTIYDGLVAGDVAVNTILRGLRGVPFRINRKYINGNYNGMDYNSMIGELATCNLVQGTSSTINTWFTMGIVSIGTNGETSTSKPGRVKSMGVNPNARESNSSGGSTSGMITIGSSLIDPNTFEVYESDGKTPFKGDENAIITRKARAFGIKNGLSMNEPYDTEWGRYDPRRNKIIPAERPEVPPISSEEIPISPEQPSGLDEEVPQGDILESADTLNTDAKAKGYLRTERRKNVWEALTLAQKNALLAMSKLKGEQTMKTLESPAYFDNNKKEFKKDITTLLGGFKLRKVTSSKKVWNQQQERRWLAKVLPNLNQAERLRIVDAAIKVGNEKNPITAWGMFQNGIITIWSKAAKGTLYHEAFHAVTDLLLTDDERKAMFNSARQAYGNLEPIALEERLAEDFRRYVQLEEKPVIGRLIRLFRTLKHILQNLLGKEPYLNALFYKINRGEFANREPKVIKSTIKLSKNTAEEEEILRNAPRDSEGRLLAPNGKPSNLTERQYVQVRTKAFKDWFGDWENDPANASKVIDENGEPKVMYHGTNHGDWSVLDTKSHSDDGISFFTADNREVAWSYKGEDFEPTTELRFDRETGWMLDSGTWSRRIEDFAADGYEITEKQIEDFYNGKEVTITRSRDKAKTTNKIFEFFVNSKNPLVIKNESPIQWNELSLNGKRASTREVSEYALNNGYDGVIIENVYDMGPYTREEDMQSLDILKPTNEAIIFNPNQIKSATDNIGTFDPNNPDIRYRLNDSKEETLRREMQRFLDNFGITLEEVNENYDGNLFDDLNRIIYYNSVEDITDGVGKAVAFMMQKQKVMTDLISLYNNFGNNTKGLKRGLKNVAKAIEKAETKEDKQKADFRLPGQKKDENIADALEAIGKDISKELRKLYGFGEEKPSFLNKVWDVIVEFFRMLTPQTRMMFDVIKHQSQHIANSIKINDKSLVIKGMVKPKTDTTATRVDVAQALRENPYEEGIIAYLSTKGIALAGSASIALNGTLYRPKENPLHDIDFQASQYNKGSLDKIVEELSPYWMHTNTIAKEGEGSTETYMILDRPFVSEPYRIPKKNKEGETKGYTKVAVIKDKNTGDILGYRIVSDLILKDGVKGKMLDFFTGKESSPYGYHSMNLNGKNYLISDPRNALAAKVKWLRLKDLWDYNRYVPDDRMVNTNQQSDREVAERVKNAKIIWGHPAIGKTTYIEKHKDEILEWDEEVNPKRDMFINSQVDPNGTLTDEERRQKKREYMRDWKDHPEYIAFLTREWENLKDRAKKENKQIFASPTPLLNLFMDDFDLFLNLTEHEFMQRNQAREAGGYYSSLGWKQAINDALVRVNPDKLVTTDKYFSQIMGDDSMTPSEASGKTPTSSAELIHNTLSDIRSFYSNELAYGNLNQEQLDYLEQRKISMGEYNSMTMLEKEVLFKCMFDGD